MCTSSWRSHRHLLTLVLTLAILWPVTLLPQASVTPVSATQPGANGRIAFASSRVTAANPTGDFEIFSMKPDGSELQQLTSNTTDDRWPAWSPDGKKIAYANGANHIVVMDANGGSPTPLTSGSGGDALPTWAPGGGFIAFTRFQGGQTNIFTMQSNGANQTQITTGPWNSEPDWSPDGSRIAFEGRTGSSFALYTALIDGSDRTRVMPASVTPDRDPSWSPDGTKLAFYRQVGFQNDIFVVNADGSNEVNLTVASRNEYYPAWSPDGTGIAFVADVAGSSDIVTMSANGSNPQTLAANPGQDEAPSWQPDSRRVPPDVKGPPKFTRGDSIVFSSNRDGDFEIFVLKRNAFTGDTLTQLTSNTVDDLTPAWSPDGTKIAFGRDGDIYVMNADGTNHINITSNPLPHTRPSWSPDGARIVFSRQLSQSNSDLFTMNANGSNLSALTTTLQDSEFTPDWSPDGARIVFVDSVAGNTALFVMNADGSNRRLLFDYPLNETSPKWSPDGTQIAFVSNGERPPQSSSLQTDIYTMRADGTNPINRTQTPQLYEDGPAWSPDGKQIAYSVRTGNNPATDLFTMKVNGTSRTNRSNHPASDGAPDWTANLATSMTSLATGAASQHRDPGSEDKGQKDNKKKGDKAKNKKKHRGKGHGARGPHRRSNEERDRRYHASPREKGQEHRHRRLRTRE